MASSWKPHKEEPNCRRSSLQGSATLPDGRVVAVRVTREGKNFTIHLTAAQKSQDVVRKIEANEIIGGHHSPIEGAFGQVMLRSRRAGFEVKPGDA
jgi:hypothetical protein